MGVTLGGVQFGAKVIRKIPLTRKAGDMLSPFKD